MSYSKNFHQLSVLKAKLKLSASPTSVSMTKEDLNNKVGDSNGILANENDITLDSHEWEIIVHSSKARKASKSKIQLSGIIYVSPGVIDADKISIVGCNISIIDKLPHTLSTKLKVLYGSNNCLTSLNGIQYLSNLHTVSLSNNLIRYTDEVRYLSLLEHLEKLSLTGNIVCGMPYYRENVLYLCGNRLTQLDGMRVSTQEKSQVAIQARKAQSILDQYRCNELRNIILEHICFLIKAHMELLKIVRRKFSAFLGDHIPAKQMAGNSSSSYSDSSALDIGKIIKVTHSSDVFRWIQIAGSVYIDRVVQDTAHRAFLVSLRKTTPSQRTKLAQNPAQLSAHWDTVMALCLHRQQQQVIKLLQQCHNSGHFPDSFAVISSSISGTDYGSHIRSVGMKQTTDRKGKANTSSDVTFHSAIGTSRLTNTILDSLTMIQFESLADDSDEYLAIYKGDVGYYQSRFSTTSKATATPFVSFQDTSTGIRNSTLTSTAVSAASEKSISCSRGKLKGTASGQNQCRRSRSASPSLTRGKSTFPGIHNNTQMSSKDTTLITSTRSTVQSPPPAVSMDTNVTTDNNNNLMNNHHTVDRLDDASVSTSASDVSSSKEIQQKYLRLLKQPRRKSRSACSSSHIDRGSTAIGGQELDSSVRNIHLTSCSRESSTAATSATACTAPSLNSYSSNSLHTHQHQRTPDQITSNLIKPPNATNSSMSGQHHTNTATSSPSSVTASDVVSPLTLPSATTGTSISNSNYRSTDFNYAVHTSTSKDESDIRYRHTSTPSPITSNRNSGRTSPVLPMADSFEKSSSRQQQPYFNGIDNKHPIIVQSVQISESRDPINYQENTSVHSHHSAQPGQPPINIQSQKANGNITINNKNFRMVSFDKSLQLIPSDLTTNDTKSSPNFNLKFKLHTTLSPDTSEHNEELLLSQSTPTSAYYDQTHTSPFNETSEKTPPMHPTSCQLPSSSHRRALSALLETESPMASMPMNQTSSTSTGSVANVIRNPHMMRQLYPTVSDNSDSKNPSLVLPHNGNASPLSKDSSRYVPDYNNGIHSNTNAFDYDPSDAHLRAMSNIDDHQLGIREWSSVKTATPDDDYQATIGSLVPRLPPKQSEDEEFLRYQRNSLSPTSTSPLVSSRFESVTSPHDYIGYHGSRTEHDGTSDVSQILEDDNLTEYIKSGVLNEPEPLFEPTSNIYAHYSNEYGKNSEERDTVLTSPSANSRYFASISNTSDSNHDVITRSGRENSSFYSSPSVFIGTNSSNSSILKKKKVVHWSRVNKEYSLPEVTSEGRKDAVNLEYPAASTEYVAHGPDESTTTSASPSVDNSAARPSPGSDERSRSTSPQQRETQQRQTQQQQQRVSANSAFIPSEFRSLPSIDIRSPALPSKPNMASNVVTEIVHDVTDFVWYQPQHPNALIDQFQSQLVRLMDNLATQSPLSPATPEPSSPLETSSGPSVSPGSGGSATRSQSAMSELKMQIRHSEDKLQQARSEILKSSQGMAQLANDSKQLLQLLQTNSIRGQMALQQRYVYINYKKQSLQDLQRQADSTFSIFIELNDRETELSQLKNRQSDVQSLTSEILDHISAEEGRREGLQQAMENISAAAVKVQIELENSSELQAAIREHQASETALAFFKSTALNYSRRIALHAFYYRVYRQKAVRHLYNQSVSRRRTETLQFMFGSWALHIKTSVQLKNLRRQQSFKSLTKSFCAWNRTYCSEMSIKIFKLQSKIRIKKSIFYHWKSYNYLERRDMLVEGYLDRLKNVFIVRKVFQSWRKYTIKVSLKDSNENRNLQPAMLKFKLSIFSHWRRISRYSRCILLEKENKILQYRSRKLQSFVLIEWTSVLLSTYHWYKAHNRYACRGWFKWMRNNTIARWNVILASKYYNSKYVTQVLVALRRNAVRRCQLRLVYNTLHIKIITSLIKTVWRVWVEWTGYRQYRRLQEEKALIHYFHSLLSKTFSAWVQILPVVCISNSDELIQQQNGQIYFSSDVSHYSDVMYADQEGSLYMDIAEMAGYGNENQEPVDECGETYQLTEAPLLHQLFSTATEQCSIYCAPYITMRATYAPATDDAKHGNGDCDNSGGQAGEGESESHADTDGQSGDGAGDSDGQQRGDSGLGEMCPSGGGSDGGDSSGSSGASSSHPDSSEPSSGSTSSDDVSACETADSQQSGRSTNVSVEVHSKTLQSSATVAIRYFDTKFPDLEEEDRSEQFGARVYSAKHQSGQQRVLIKAIKRWYRRCRQYISFRSAQKKVIERNAHSYQRKSFCAFLAVYLRHLLLIYADLTKRIKAIGEPQARLLALLPELHVTSIRVREAHGRLHDNSRKVADLQLKIDQKRHVLGQLERESVMAQQSVQSIQAATQKLRQEAQEIVHKCSTPELKGSGNVTIAMGLKQSSQMQSDVDEYIYWGMDRLLNKMTAGRGLLLSPASSVSEADYGAGTGETEDCCGVRDLRLDSSVPHLTSFNSRNVAPNKVDVLHQIDILRQRQHLIETNRQLNRASRMEQGKKLSDRSEHLQIYKTDIENQIQIALQQQQRAAIGLESCQQQLDATRLYIKTTASEHEQQLADLQTIIEEMERRQKLADINEQRLRRQLEEDREECVVANNDMGSAYKMAQVDLAAADYSSVSKGSLASTCSAANHLRLESAQTLLTVVEDWDTRHQKNTSQDCNQLAAEPSFQTSNYSSEYISGSVEGLKNAIEREQRTMQLDRERRIMKMLIPGELNENTADAWHQHETITTTIINSTSNEALILSDSLAATRNTSTSYEQPTVASNLTATMLVSEDSSAISSLASRIMARLLQPPPM